ncbi:MAG: heavy-metal-associated domain-containing protein [Coriobacteriia bacterium]|nr:heavy-metal-associated domain-containing protein [Coriobacteriia bacterium]
MGGNAEVTLKTTGMHCHSCAMLVDMTVSELEGVDEVATEYATGATRVVFDSDLLALEDIIAAIRAAGYDAAQE